MAVSSVLSREAEFRHSTMREEETDKNGRGVEGERQEQNTFKASPGQMISDVDK